MSNEAMKWADDFSTICSAHVQQIIAILDLTVCTDVILQREKESEMSQCKDESLYETTDNCLSYHV